MREKRRKKVAIAHCLQNVAHGRLLYALYFVAMMQRMLSNEQNEWNEIERETASKNGGCDFNNNNERR